MRELGQRRAGESDWTESEERAAGAPYARRKGRVVPPWRKRASLILRHWRGSIRPRRRSGGVDALRAERLGRTVQESAKEVERT